MTFTNEQPILFRNTMRVNPGHLDDFTRAIDRAVAFSQDNGPQLMVEVFIDEEQLLTYSFQLYPDSDAILKHWELSDPYIQGVMDHCSVVQLDVYGHPNQAVVDGLKQSGANGIPVSFHPRLSGFSRLTNPPATDG